MKCTAYGLCLAIPVVAFAAATAVPDCRGQELRFVERPAVALASYSHDTWLAQEAPPAPPPEDGELPRPDSRRGQVPLETFLAPQDGVAPTCGCRANCCPQNAACPALGGSHCPASCAPSCAPAGCESACVSPCRRDNCQDHCHHGAHRMLDMIFSPAGALRANCYPTIRSRCYSGCGTVHAGCAPSCGFVAAAPAAPAALTALTAPAPTDIYTPVNVIQSADATDIDPYGAAPLPPTWEK